MSRTTVRAKHSWRYLGLLLVTWLALYLLAQGQNERADLIGAAVMAGGLTLLTREARRCLRDARRNLVRLWFGFVILGLLVPLVVLLFLEDKVPYRTGIPLFMVGFWAPLSAIVMIISRRLLRSRDAPRAVIAGILGAVTVGSLAAILVPLQTVRSPIAAHEQLLAKISCKDEGYTAPSDGFITVKTPWENDQIIHVEAGSITYLEPRYFVQYLVIIPAGFFKFAPGLSDHELVGSDSLSEKAKNYRQVMTDIVSLGVITRASDHGFMVVCR